MAAGSWARGCPVPSAPLEGAGSNAADATFVRSAQIPLRMRSRYPPFAKNAKDGAPLCVGDASEIKSLGHPARSDLTSATAGIAVAEPPTVTSSRIVSEDTECDASSTGHNTQPLQPIFSCGFGFGS